MLEDRELAKVLYNGINFFCGFIVILFNLLQSNRKRLPLSLPLCGFYSKLSKNNIKNINENKILIFQVVLFSFLQYIPVPFLNTKFGYILNTGTNYFALLFFMPLILLIFSITFWINPLRSIDFLTPAYTLSLAISKVSCFLSGCCNGMYWKNGLYNYDTYRNEVPIQLIEAFSALLIFLFLLFIRKRAKTGTMFPIYLITYSTVRFFTEFLRGEDNVFGPLKIYHIFCIVGIVIGVIELVIIRIYINSVEQLFSETVYGRTKKWFYDKMKNAGKSGKRKK